MQLPVNWKGSPDADPDEILGLVMAEAASFNSGLSICFGNNSLNPIGSYLSTGRDSKSVAAGGRAPDVKLTKPGTLETTRLHKETPNMARFYIVVFVGEVDKTSSSLTQFSRALSLSKFFKRASWPISWLTIPASHSPSAFEPLEMKPFGKIFYDQLQRGHCSFETGRLAGDFAEPKCECCRGAGKIFRRHPDTRVATLQWAGFQSASPRLPLNEKTTASRCRAASSMSSWIHV